MNRRNEGTAGCSGGRRPGRKRAALASAWALFLLAVSAQGAPLVLENVRVLDGAGNGAKDGTTLVIEDGTFSRVTQGHVAPLKDEQRMDLSGKTIMPGLISNHSHVGVTDGVDSSAENYNRANIERQLRQFQRYGITTVTSLGLNGDLFGALRDEAHLGIGPGADLYGADRGIGVPNAAPPGSIAKSQLYRPQTPEQARQAVRDMLTRSPDLVKIWVDDFYGSLHTKMAPAIYQAVIEEAHSHGSRVAAHVYYLEDAKRLVDSGVDILAHGIRDAEVDDALIAAMKRGNVWYIPTLDLDESFFSYAESQAGLRDPFLRAALQPSTIAQFEDPAWQRSILSSPRFQQWRIDLDRNKKNFIRMLRAGVNIGFGTDSGATPLRVIGVAEHRELQLMVEAGATPTQAIAIATSGAARLLGLTDRGTIKEGQRADFVVLGADPLVNIRATEQIEAVWQGGRQVSGPVSP